MNKGKLLKFLVDARTKTYAGGSNSVTLAFPGGYQYEFKEEDFLYYAGGFIG